MRLYRRSLSRSRSRSRPVRLTVSRIPADTSPMISTTISISISVNPAAGRPGRRRRRLGGLLVEIPVTDVRIDAVAAGLAVGTEGADVVSLAVRAGEREHVVVAPGVLADALDVAALFPVLDRGIGRLRGERGEALIVARVLGIVHVEHGERRLEALDVLLGLGHLGVIDPPHHAWHDHRSQQADDDHDHHDLDEGEAARAAGPAVAASANLVDDVLHA